MHLLSKVEEKNKMFPSVLIDRKVNESILHPLSETIQIQLSQDVVPRAESTTHLMCISCQSNRLGLQFSEWHSGTPNDLMRYIRLASINDITFFVG